VQSQYGIVLYKYNQVENIKFFLIKPISIYYPKPVGTSGYVWLGSQMVSHGVHAVASAHFMLELLGSQF